MSTRKNRHPEPFIKRDLSHIRDYVKIPQPGVNAWVDVKFMTYPILLDNGAYVSVVWDVVDNSPKLLLLNHSLFDQVKDWIKNNSVDGEDLVGQAFSVKPKSIGGRIIGHDLISKGLGTLLLVHQAMEIRRFIDETFEFYELRTARFTKVEFSEVVAGEGTEAARERSLLSAGAEKLGVDLDLMVEHWGVEEVDDDLEVDFKIIKMPPEIPSALPLEEKSVA